MMRKNRMTLRKMQKKKQWIEKKKIENWMNFGNVLYGSVPNWGIENSCDDHGNVIDCNCGYLHHCDACVRNHPHRDGEAEEEVPEDKTPDNHNRPSEASVVHNEKVEDLDDDYDDCGDDDHGVRDDFCDDAGDDHRLPRPYYEDDACHSDSFDHLNLNF
jgi:hypothetical protein